MTLFLKEYSTARGVAIEKLVTAFDFVGRAALEALVEAPALIFDVHIVGDAQLAKVFHALLRVLEQRPDDVHVQNVQCLVPDQVDFESLRAVLNHLRYDLNVSFLKAGLDVDLPLVEVGLLHTIDKFD
eukprot:CAMPEP_0185590914 /NCGR_PEP_ID=MMETSP0434-20130131/62538_1 /TAXON_ID=626734 ORGANISM="Favella taraikaensis, Strain Fe Narragansett Bay" /NCGR_SAMPLE_ID=MMETSP0434 /ASSEMBLY_ACC=CAM_ASM_000379 /LENGTH=127 /DNA_ID=CAMNT_0028215485 /DNA_START=1008 /DNA_END=1392 /DNA_ORIENTATION=+